MEAVGSVANIIAVVELSAKVATLLLKYSKAVKNAKPDIERLLQQLEALGITLEGAKSLLSGPNAARLGNLQQLHEGLEGCSVQLKELDTKLGEKLSGRHESGAARVMGRFGIRALKWPLESPEVDKIVTSLHDYRDTVSAALTIDQTEQILIMAQDFVLSKLPNVKDAAFNSYANEHHARCHPKTRLDLRENILRWANDSESQCIYWLNGMAGTGKFTISHTVAQSFADNGQLAASFFFRRGERDRGNAAQLFTTIASQIVARDPNIAAAVRSSLETDPAIAKCDSVDTETIVFVIDALDECERDDDIRLIIHLLSQGKKLKSVRLKTFLTSRPDLPVRLGFNSIQGNYQDLVLHQIPAPVIQKDISEFLNSELAKIKEDYNALSVGDKLPLDWPGSEVIQNLAYMAIPLFIFASTVCRFIGDPAWSDPAGQLTKVLQYHSAGEASELDKLDATYRPVMDRLIVGSKTAQRSIVDEFHLIVGSIVLLSEPLSALSLSQLLGVSKSIIDRRLMPLHSVLHVPADGESPIRTLHLSFHDFLVDPDKRHTNPFWMDKVAAHERLATRSLALLSSQKHFKDNLCDLEDPAATVEDVPSGVISERLPAEIRYASLYWVDHLVASNAPLTDSHEAYVFLQKHFLHWLEALSYFRKIPESILIIRKLQCLVTPQESGSISAFLHDALRFVLTFNQIIAQCPLQVYSSAIVFAPEMSVIKNIFLSSVPKWISQMPPVMAKWDDCLLTFDNVGFPKLLHFSLNGKTIAFCGSDDTLQYWDLDTGVKTQSHQLVGSKILALSPDGKTIAAVKDKRVCLPNSATGEDTYCYDREVEYFSDVRFSADGKMMLLLDYDGVFRLLELASWKELLKINSMDGNEDSEELFVYPRHATLAPNQNSIAVSVQRTLKVCNAETGRQLWKIHGHDNIISTEYSSDSQRIIIAFPDGIVSVFDSASGNAELRVNTGTGNSHWRRAVFSPDGKKFATNSNDTLRVWDAETGTELTALIGHYSAIKSLAYSPDGKTIATGGSDGTVRIWDVSETAGRNVIKSGGAGDDVSASLSPHDAEQSIEHNIQEDCYMNTRLGCVMDPKGLTSDFHESYHTLFRFSLDRKRAAIIFDKGNNLWVMELKTVERDQLLECNSLYNIHDTLVIPCAEECLSFAFSGDSRTLATFCKDKIIRLHDAISGEEKQMIDFREYNLEVVSDPSVAFSINNRTVAFACPVERRENERVWLWDIVTGDVTDVTPRHYRRGNNGMAVSPDGQLIAAICGYGNSIQVWDAIPDAPAKTLVEIPSFALSVISFSADNRQIELNRGCISLDEGQDGDPPLFVEMEWICRGSKKILRIPPDHRSYTAAVYDNVVSLRHKSGRFIGFSF
ncbi:hypothetical protein FE257_009471 [Aspergillus nanangensis]|uniref:NACHT domain-containing protein n=1 Tax=Aspergillus nanangensis TaxID=2582783 RepID=A0AAD4CJZ7_ASPNN|nr:hypothetical protein FE257_009471 [Aspergillus nanangensis]